MTEKEVKLFMAYFDAKIAYEFACREAGEDGQTSRPLQEAQAVEAAEKAIHEFYCSS